MWEKVVRKLRAGVMPPQGARRPDDATMHALVASLEDEPGSRLPRRIPNPGRPLLHRLNRAEYKNAIRDLLALDVDVAALLPPDDSAYGFDNISDVLGVSPSLQERYLDSGRQDQPRSRSAIARCGPAATPIAFRRICRRTSTSKGLPLGTVGGLQVRHTFPLDGEYEFRTQLYRTNLNIVRGLQYPSEFEIAIDGRQVHRVTIGGNDDLAAMFDKPTDTGDAVELRMRVRVPVKAGPHEVTVDVHREHGREGHGTAAAVPAQLGRQLRLGGPAAHPDASRSPARSMPTAPATQPAVARSSPVVRRAHDASATAPRRS